MALLDHDLEERLKAEVFPLLENARKDYDLDHTKSTVRHMKLILDAEAEKYNGIDQKILITAMYLHDIGYAGLIAENRLANVLDLKKVHMVIGAKMAKEILEKIGGYSSEEIREVVHLVSIHDDLENLATDAELFVMEADSLGMIDYGSVKPYPGLDQNEFIERFERRRAPRFITDTGKYYLSILLPNAKSYLTG